MPENATVTVTASAGGRSYTTNQNTTGENKGGSSPTVTAAKSGTLTTRTDANTGTLTMAASHGITTAAKVDIYWADGSRRDVTVGTVSGNSVPIDLGAGDDLPVLNTAVTVKVVQTEGAWAVPGANVTYISAKAPQYAGTVVIQQSDGTEIAAFVLAAGQSYIWSDQSGITNPVTGATIGKATFSHASVDGSQEMSLDFLYN